VGRIIIVTRHADDYCCANCIRFPDRKRIAVSHRNNCVFAPTEKATKDSPAKDVGSLAKVRITSIHVAFATLKMLISLEGAHVFNVTRRALSSGGGRRARRVPERGSKQAPSNANETGLHSPVSRRYHVFLEW
jgi:hypothetical protein